MQGVIKKLVADRGFGFITVQGQPKDYFFHKEGLVDVEYDDLHEGDQLTFDVQESDNGKGPKAVNIRRA